MFWPLVAPSCLVNIQLIDWLRGTHISFVQQSRATFLCGFTKGPSEQAASHSLGGLRNACLSSCYFSCPPVSTHDLSFLPRSSMCCFDCMLLLSQQPTDLFHLGQEIKKQGCFHSLCNEAATTTRWPFSTEPGTLMRGVLFLITTFQPPFTLCWA